MQSKKTGVDGFKTTRILKLRVPAHALCPLVGENLIKPLPLVMAPLLTTNKWSERGSLPELTAILINRFVLVTINSVQER